MTHYDTYYNTIQYDKLRYSTICSQQSNFDIGHAWRQQLLLPQGCLLRTRVFHGLEAFACSWMNADCDIATKRHSDKATAIYDTHFKLPQIKQIFALWQSIFDFCASFAVLIKTRTHFTDTQIYIYMYVCIYIYPQVMLTVAATSN